MIPNSLVQHRSQLEQTVRQYDIGRLAAALEPTRLAIEQFRASSVFDSLAASEKQLRELSNPANALLHAVKRIEEVSRSLGVHSALTDPVARRLPLYDFQRQLTASTAYTQVASLTLRTVDLDRLGALISSAELPRERAKLVTARLARRHADLVSSGVRAT